MKSKELSELSKFCRDAGMLPVHTDSYDTEINELLLKYGMNPSPEKVEAYVIIIRMLLLQIFDMRQKGADEETVQYRVNVAKEFIDSFAKK